MASESIPAGWSSSLLSEFIDEVDLRLRDLAPSEQKLEVLSLTKRWGLLPQSDRFDKRIATDDVDAYKVVRTGWIVYNPYVIWEGAVHALRRLQPGLVSPVYAVWKRKANDGGFLDLLLRTPDLIQEYERFAAGAVNRRRSIRKSDFLSIRISCPPIHEQRQIAKVLLAAQQAIERHERVIAVTAKLKKTLTHKLFTEGTRGEPFKQTQIGPVPESWTVDRLDSFCVLQRGFDITKAEQTEGRVPVVSSGGIKSYHNVAKVQGPGVIVGRKGSLGTVHYVEVPYWPHDTTLWVKDFRGNDPRFTAFFLERLDFARFDSGASNPTLNRNTVHAETVAYPPIDQQHEIATALSSVEHKTNLHERITTSLQSFFQTLLQLLMTGQVRVHDLDLSALEEADEDPVGAV